MHPYAFGARKDPHDPRDFRFSSVFHSLSLPERFSLRDEMSPVKSQGVRGSCVAFAICSIREWQEAKERKRPASAFDLSEEFIYAFTRLPGGGAYPREAMKCIVTHGITIERFLKYSDIPDNEALDPPKKTIKNLRMFGAARRFRAGGYVRLSSVGDVMQSLVENGPCFIGIMWQRNWSGQKRTLLEPGDGVGESGHAVVAVGYDRSRMHFIVRNSWGADWADGGYSRLPFDSFEKHHSDCWAIHDKKSVIQYARD